MGLVRGTPDMLQFKWVYPHHIVDIIFSHRFMANFALPISVSLIPGNLACMGILSELLTGRDYIISHCFISLWLSTPYGRPVPYFTCEPFSDSQIDFVL